METTITATRQVVEDYQRLFVNRRAFTCSPYGLTQRPGGTTLSAKQERDRHPAVTNTTNDKKRGQIVPYADSRAYTDRLNALFTSQGWTREYKVQTMTNITRVKKGESIVSGKVLVTCTVTILGIGSHSGTGEEWADDDNGMTSADAQAFKRACSCFGLGRYFYDIPPLWVDLDQNRQPVRTPVLSAWALPENWRKGMRPPGKNGNGKANATNSGIGSNGGRNGNHGQATKSQARPTNGGGNGHAQTTKANGSAAAGSGDDLDACIRGDWRRPSVRRYSRGILREYGLVANQLKLIRDAAIEGKFLTDAGVRYARLRPFGSCYPTARPEHGEGAAR